tara:strand:+ start:701 stop:1927 length:1227 start_codon:yes stop_codon:yes gene_type:complete
MTTFSGLSVQGWRQFSDIELDLTAPVTILTGANGTGKTSVLNLLGKHYGWNTNFITTPHISKRRKSKIWNDFISAITRDNLEDGSRIDFGTITYSDKSKCNLWAQNTSGPQYIPNYDNMKPVIGIHIPSHRPNNSYHSVASIPTNPKSSQQHYQEYQNILLQTYGSSPRQNPGLIQKQSLISLALFGYGNEAVAKNPEYISVFEGFQNIIHHFLPADIGFQKIEIRMPEVVLKTSSGDFALEAMSGGINALFGIAWQIYMFGQDHEQVTVTIDEPENHLHPSMQRSLIPALQSAFPQHKFIVATHSPFVVTSSRDAAVYGLYHDADRRVHSTRLSERDLAGSPNKILRDILNVPSTLPIWAEEAIAAAIRESEGSSNEQRAAALWGRLEELGITESIESISEDSGEKN